MSKQAHPLHISLLLIIIALVSLAGGYWLNQYLQTDGSGSRIPEGLEATVLDPARPLAPFTLEDHNKAPFTLQTLKGHWSFLFFGYTHCPDVCPITLQAMQVAWKQIPHSRDDPAAPHLYFISVDPDRDTPDMLKRYVQYFDPGFIGVTGKADEIDKLANRIGVLYGFEDKKPGSDEYQVNHSAQIILIDPHGNMRAVFSPPHDPATIARNFKTIRDYYGD
jgi:protein SCO1/2